MSGMSNYLENKLIDQLFRAQVFSFPITLYFALLTAAPNDTGGGTEVSGGGYARVPVVASLANFAGTQGAGSTTASTGTTATTSNNGAVTFPAPSAAWGVVGWMAVYDAGTTGNLLWYSPLAVAKTINSGDAAPSFPAASFALQLDN